MRNDIKMAAKIIQVLDRRWGLWEDQDGEKKDTEKQVFHCVLYHDKYIMDLKRQKNSLFNVVEMKPMSCTLKKSYMF